MIDLKVFEDSNLFFESSYDEPQELLVGRGSGCDVILNGNPGISREHFKVIIKDDFTVDIELVSSTGKLIYNGSNIKNIELTKGETVVSLPPYDFKFSLPLEEEKNNLQPEPVHEEIQLEQEETETQSENTALSTSSNNESSIVPSGFDLDEKTKTAISAPLEYAMKIFKGERMLQEIALQGVSWDFGRDEKCHYTIKSKKTSRKHFTILNNNSKFYVKDLGSSNGTFLNKQQLPVNQEIELKSGDFIEVSDFRFIFEIKDNSFEKRIKDVELIENFDHQDSIGEIEALRQNALSVSDEFMKLPPSQRPSALAQKPKKTNYLRPALLLLIIGVGAFYYMQENTEKIDSAELASIERQKRLAKEQTNAAIDKFNLALRFYNESQFERCMFEIDEFAKFDIETEETAGATELRNQCEIEKERQQRQKDLEIQAEKQLAIENRINEIIDFCTPKAQEGVAVLKPCVDEAASLDPANSRIQSLLDIAESKDMEREQALADKKAYNKSVSIGKSLYTKAKKYDSYGDWKRAIKAYKKHLRSKYPDPGKLKAKSKRNIASITTRIDNELNESIKKASAFAANNEYKKTILAANKGLQVNRDHKELLQLKKDAERNLKIILRKYYQNSIIQEDYHEISEAKLLWNKILKEGVPGSDYHNKAKIKLKYYEEGS